MLLRLALAALSLSKAVRARPAAALSCALVLALLVPLAVSALLAVPCALQLVLARPVLYVSLAVIQHEAFPLGYCHC